MNAVPPKSDLSGASRLPRDQLGRPLHDLRISVMDRCNFRCPYCMPETTYGEHFTFLGNDERLSFDEIERLSRLAVSLGVSKLRLTGGEPLLRPNLADLISRLRRLEGVDDLAMTTNGVLLARQANDLRKAGLDRITISLDTLDPAIFHRLSGGRGALEDVMAGIEAAQASGFPKGIKLNAVIQRGVNDDTALDLVERFRGSGIVVRLIEYMDVGNRNDWASDAVVPSRELVERINARWPLEAVAPQYPGEVATRYRFLDGIGEVGTISSVSNPFCGRCSRARLSSEGLLYTCLFATKGADLRTPLRNDESDEALTDRLRTIWLGRADRYSEERAARRQQNPQKIEMHYIGG
jgi:cyclic pyranopterin phosphate synthase